MTCGVFLLYCNVKMGHVVDGSFYALDIYIGKFKSSGKIAAYQLINNQLLINE